MLCTIFLWKKEIGCDTIKRPIMNLKRKYIRTYSIIWKNLYILYQIAIVGYNGAGKTTLIKLLLRFFMMLPKAIFFIKAGCKQRTVYSVGVWCKFGFHKIPPCWSGCMVKGNNNLFLIYTQNLVLNMTFCGKRPDFFRIIAFSLAVSVSWMFFSPRWPSWFWVHARPFYDPIQPAYADLCQTGSYTHGAKCFYWSLSSIIDIDRWIQYNINET